MEERRGVVLSQGGQAWRKPNESPSEFCLAVGPEGGFTDQEVELAGQCHWDVVGLGPRNLRVETAALVGVTLA